MTSAQAVANSSFLPDWAFAGVLITAVATILGSRTLHWLQTRRDVYLDFGPGFQAAGRAMALLANPAVPLDIALSEYKEPSAALAKASLLAKPKLLSAITKVQNHVGESFLLLIGERAKLIPFESDIAAWAPMRERNQTQIDRTLEEQRRFNIDNLVDPPRWQVLQSNFDFHIREIEKIDLQLDKARREVLLHTLGAARLALRRQREMLPLTAEVIAQARLELGLFRWTFDKDSFAEELEAGMQKAIEHAEQQIKEVEALTASQN
ncbi:MAG: hypothetical protein ACTHOL_17455 [Luteibacter jiangsuensis]